MLDPAKLLDPIARRWNEWCFHYPVYPNTYCLAFNLAALVYAETKDWRSLRSCLIQDDWAEGLPRFTRRFDYQFFIAEDTRLEQLRAVTDCVMSEPFTDYAVQFAFARNNTRDEALRFTSLLEAIKYASDNKTQRIIVVTDIPPTAAIVVQRMRQLCAEQSFRPDIQIADWWRREIADFRNDALKFYVMGAGGTQFLLNRGARYAQIALDDFPPVPTYICVRYAADASIDRAREMLGAIREYYAALFLWAENCAKEDAPSANGSTTPKPPVSLKDIGENYVRIAHSSRQFDPFEVRSDADGQDHLGYPMAATLQWDKDYYYMKLLARHHAGVRRSVQAVNSV